MKSLIPIRSDIAWGFVLSLAFSPLYGAELRVEPAIIDQDYQGALTLKIDGIAPGDSVSLEKYLDIDTDGAINPVDMLVQCFSMTDGLQVMVGGVRNRNIPSDDDGKADGSIQFTFPYLAQSEANFVAGRYIYRLSSPDGAFVPVLGEHSIEPADRLQAITGRVTSNGSGVSSAFVFIDALQRPDTRVRLSMTDPEGFYHLPTPPGDYSVGCLKEGYVFDFASMPKVTVASGQTLVQNLVLTEGTVDISGRVEVAGTEQGVPGIQLFIQAEEGWATLAMTRLDGTFQVRVHDENQWSIDVSQEDAGFHGVVNEIGEVFKQDGGYNPVILSLPPANALIYGQVLNLQDVPLANITLEADSDEGYELHGVTNQNGEYVLGVHEGRWEIELELPNDMYAEGTFATVLTGQAREIAFLVKNYTSFLRGQVLLDNGESLPGAEIAVTQEYGGSWHGTLCDAEGRFSLGVLAGRWYLHLSSDEARRFEVVRPIMGFDIVDGVDIDNIIYRLKPATSWIMASLTDGGGAPIPNVGISASHQANGVSYQAWDESDRLGRVRLGVFDGLWMVGPDCGPLQSRGYDCPGTQLVDIAGSDRDLVFSTGNVPPLQINTLSLPGGTVGEEYDAWLQASGGLPPYEWSLAVGSASLPEGLSLGANGRIAGIPQLEGEFFFIVRVVDALGGASQGVFSIRLAAPLQLESQPRSVQVRANTTVELSVAAVGEQPIRYQWRINGNEIDGATSATLVLSAITVEQAGSYDVVVSNASGSITSQSAIVTVIPLDWAPVEIVVPPQSYTAIEGEEIILSVGVAGSGDYEYQWHFQSNDIEGATGASLDLGSADAGMAGEYSVTVWDEFSSDTSATAVLAVVTPPFIGEDPVDQDVTLGEALRLRITAGGTDPLAFQWRRNGNNIPGATGPEFIVTEFQPGDGGSYSVVVLNPFGVVESGMATVRPMAAELPASDSFAERGWISGSSGVGVANNITATREAEEPQHAGKAGGASVWLRWQGDRNGTLELDTDGSDFDTILAVYTGSFLAELTEAASNEDDGERLTSRVILHTEAGVEYSIAIDAFDGAMGHIVFGWMFEADEVPLPVILDQSEGRVVAAGESVQLEIQAIGQGLFYQWFRNDDPVPGGDSPVLELNAFSPSDVGVYAVILQDALGREVSSRPIRIELGAAGQSLSTRKLGDLWESSPRLTPFRVASAITEHGFSSVAAGVVGSQVMENVGAVREIGERNHGNDPRATGGSIWYGLTPESNGILFLDTEGSEIETVIAVYQGRDFETQTWLACSEAATDLPGFPRVALPVRADAEYAVAMVGLDGAEGQVRLNWVLATTGYRVLDLKLSGNGFQILESAPAGVVLELQRSRDMRTWQKLHRGRRNSGILKFLDKDVIKQHRWVYRITEIE